MFKSARIKLTAWYLLIIMLISASFSVAIYRGLTSELSRIERAQRLRQEFSQDFPLPERAPFRLDPDIVEETRQRIRLGLILVNLIILGASAGAGYFLAGRTLKPISEMVDEQNRFISDASHELRTPLTSLKSEIEVNLRDKKLTLGEARKLLVSNLEEVNNLQTLSDKLIKLTKYRKGENGLTFNKISLAKVAEEAVKKVSGLARNKGITIVNKVGKYIIKGNKTALDEVFVILLDNAIKYSPKGKKVTLTCKRSDTSIAFDIKDEGYGIAKEDIPHLFDRFYRADKSRTKFEASGYGLGLAIAKEIVEKHHGTISVDSKLGEGTCVTVLLPVFSVFSDKIAKLT